MSTTPDGRQWLTSEAIAQRITSALILNGVITEDQTLVVSDIVQQAYANTGYPLEFKILRLTEKIKDQVDSGAMYNASCTSCQEIRQSFSDVYNASVLANYDEEGNYIGPA